MKMRGASFLKFEDPHPIEITQAVLAIQSFYKSIQVAFDYPPVHCPGVVVGAAKLACDQVAHIPAPAGKAGP